MALSPVLRLTLLRLLERLRSQQAQVLFARLRDAVAFPAANARLLDPAQPGDRRNAPEGLDYMAGQLGLVVAHAAKYRGSDCAVNR